MFRAKINPASPGKVKEGTIDSPVMLDGVTDEEFEMLLWVFYNPYISFINNVFSKYYVTNQFHSLIRTYSLYDADVDTWKSILHLAHKLEFKEVKSLAVRELHMKRELPLVEKMALYRNYQVDSRYLVPLFSELCSRDTPLTLEESKILGPDSTCLVYTTRESLRAQASDGGRSPLPSGIEEKDVYREIETALEMDHGSTLAFQQSEQYAAGKLPLTVTFFLFQSKLLIIFVFVFVITRKGES